MLFDVIVSVLFFISVRCYVAMCFLSRVQSDVFLADFVVAVDADAADAVIAVAIIVRDYPRMS